MKRYALFLLILLLAACNMDKIPDALVDKEADKYATNYISKVIAGDTTYCESQLNSNLLNDSARAFFRHSAALTYSKQEKKHRLVSMKYNASLTTKYGARKNVDMLYEYELNDCFAYYHITVTKTDNNYRVIGFREDFNPTSVSDNYKFGFAGKTLWQYLIFFMGIANIIFIIISIIYAIKTPLRKKWLWIIFMLFGLGQISVNWYDGGMGISVFSLGLLGFGVSKSGIIAPWIISIYMPAGAIVFWIKRRNIFKQRELDNQIAATYVSQGTQPEQHTNEHSTDIPEDTTT